MDLSTSYLSFKLAHPLVPGASPLSADLSMVRRLEDAGAPMIVLHSLFQEQIEREQVALFRALEYADDSYAEALSHLPRPVDFHLGPDEYLNHIARVKAAVAVPVVASLNGRTHGGWVDFAKLMQTAGADALELNLYDPVLRCDMDSATVERSEALIVRDVCRSVSIPVAVKLSPFYTSFAHFAHTLEAAGAKGLVLFNRFYQPDIDVNGLALNAKLRLSTSEELLPRLRWAAALYGRGSADLAVTGGVHTAVDAVKAVMAGAAVVQLASALLSHGPGYLATLQADLARWLEQHEYESLRQARGSMSFSRTPDADVLERVNYMKVLLSWSGDQ
jgi:dihydroorotate dehydrogenase (fumarate)